MHDRTAVTTDLARARGGISAGAILTGVVVAFGAMFLLSALAGGVLTAAGVTPDDISDASGVIEPGLAAGIVLVAAQFLSYLWGGYTAGRMARGAGLLNGLLVPLIAIVVAIIVGAVVAALGASANLNLPYSTNRLPLEGDYLVDWGLATAIAAVAAMLLGGALGGGLGQAWHSKLEHRRIDEVDDEHVAPGATAPERADEARARAAASEPGNGHGATTETGSQSEHHQV